MRCSYGALVLTALRFGSVLAQPAHHRHHTHHKRQNVDWSDAKNYDVDWKNVVDWSKVSYTNGFGQAPTAAASSGPASSEQTPLATTVVAYTSPQETQVTPSASSSTPTDSSPVVQTSVTSNTPVSSPTSTSTATSGSSSSTGFGGQTTPKDNGNKDEYVGNVGIPFGSNMLIIADGDKTNYKYTNKFTNKGADKICIIVWNKSGKDGQPQSGMALPPVLKFDVGPGESQTVAFDENSQVAFSQDCPRSPTSNIPDCTWGEADFGDLRNGGWSGYDRSSIPNSAGNSGLLTIECDGAETSSQDSNSFTSASQDHAGGALAPGPAHLRTSMG